MLFSSFLLCVVSFLLALALWLIFRKHHQFSKSRPPGPRGWPVIGNILDVGMMPHVNLHNLGSKYGPVICVKLGMSNTLVVQSSEAARELFKKHDLQFSDRTVPDSFTSCGFDKGTVVMSPNGEYWRTVRKLGATELSTNRRITDSIPSRQACVSNMIRWIKEDSDASVANKGSGEIQLDKYLPQMTFNVISNFLISKDILNSKSEKGVEFYEAMNMFFHWNGIPNLADTFPFLKCIDPQGIKRNSERYMRQMLKIISGFVKERIQEKKLGKENETKDYLDSLLEYNGAGEIDKLSEENVTLLVLEMFIGGSETSSVTVVWGMSEVLRNPNSMAKLKDEILQVVGNSRNVEESDLTNLKYLQAIVKEIMRLHPPGPFLLPRKARQDTEFMGYHIPENTLVLVNVWAIHRDPNLWDDPLSFKPERFMNSNIDTKGQHFELLPFGSGRRSCIGMLLGDRMVSLTIARLVQSFDWKLPVGMCPDALDMTEKVGLSVHKLVPLVAIPCWKLEEYRS